MWRWRAKNHIKLSQLLRDTPADPKKTWAVQRALCPGGANGCLCSKTTSVAHTTHSRSCPLSLCTPTNASLCVRLLRARASVCHASSCFTQPLRPHASTHSNNSTCSSSFVMGCTWLWRHKTAAQLLMSRRHTCAEEDARMLLPRCHMHS